MSAQHEIGLINRFFRDYRVSAEVNQSVSFVAGKSFAVFVLKLGAGARIAAIESRLRELAEVLSAHRGEPTPVRLRQMPLAIEVPHPAMEPLLPDPNLRLPAHSMLLGKSFSYGGECEEIVNLADAPHALIAGTTGSGKSKLLTMMLWSL